MPIQIPPAVGSSGQFVETVIVTSSQQRHVMAIGSGESTAYAPVTSSGGMGVTVMNQSTGIVPIVSASSGLVQITGGTFLTSGLVTVTNPTTAVTVNVSTAVTVTNPSTQVNTLSSGPILVLSSGPATIAGTVTILSASSGLVQLTSAPLVIAASSAGHQVGSLTSGLVSVTSGTFTLSSNPTVVSASSGVIQLSSAPLVVVATSGGVFQVATTGTLLVVNTSSGIIQAIVTGSSGVGAIVTSSGALLVSGTPGSVSTAVNLFTTLNIAYPVTSSYGQTMVLFGVGSSSRLIVGSSVGKISSAPGVLTYVNGWSTAVALAGAYLRLYDQTTNNATSSSNAGLAGASMLFRIATSVSGMPFDATHSFVHGIKFATACSFDIVLNATSTATQIAGWVTAQYTS